MGNEKKPKKKSIFSWDISWKITKEDLKNQVENYNTLGFFKSYRKLSCLVIAWLIISILIGLYIETINIPSQKLLMPIIVIFCSFLLFYLFLFYFVYRGYRWAIIVIIIIFTLETLLKEIEALETLNRVRLFPILWWLIVMPVLYRALTVENERRRLKKQDTNNTKFQITKNKVIFCQNCGKKNITPANYCKKCGNKIVK